MSKHRVSGIDSTFYSGTTDRCPEIDPDNFEQVRAGIFESPDGRTEGTPVSGLDDIKPVDIKHIPVYAGNIALGAVA